MSFVIRISTVIQFKYQSSLSSYGCRLGAELGFEDPNLTAMVSENLEKMIKRRQIACV